MTDRYLLQISRNWRVSEDELQWMLQRCMHIERYSGNRDDSRNWRGQSFCRTRKALIRCINEHSTLEADEDQGLVEAAFARVERWPEWHRPRQEPLAGVAVEPAASRQQHERPERDVA